MNPLKKGQLREEGWYMWGCGLRQHTHIYQPSLLLAGDFFSALIYVTGAFHARRGIAVKFEVDPALNLY